MTTRIAHAEYLAGYRFATTDSTATIAHCANFDRGVHAGLVARFYGADLSGGWL